MQYLQGDDSLMSRALPSWMYRNPEEVLERKQESEARRSCVGCVHSFAIEFKSGRAMGCDKNRKYGVRCDLYRSE